MVKANILYIILTILGLSACTSSSEQHHLLLSSSSLRVNLQADNTLRQQTIALRQVRLPDYLNEYHIMYQINDTEVFIDKDQQWAQDLSDNIKRVLQQNLAKQLPSASLYSYPLGASLRPQKIIDVQIIEMIANVKANTLTMLANWQVIEPGERNPMSHAFSKTYPISDESMAQLVLSYQQALSDLSQKIIPTI